MQVLITGPWGSGTTCMAACLNSAGLTFPPPHFRLYDPRNANSFENIAFRNAVLSSVDESSLSVAEDRLHLTKLRLRELQANLASVAPYGIKLPAAAFVLAEIESVFCPMLELIIVMERDDHDIAATCQRRGWPDTFGTKGADAIRERLAIALSETSTPVMHVAFEDLRSAPEAILNSVNERVSTELKIAEGCGAIRPREN